MEPQPEYISAGLMLAAPVPALHIRAKGEKPPITDISLDLNVPRLLECLANAPDQQKAHAAVVFDSYMERYKKPDIPA